MVTKAQSALQASIDAQIKANQKASSALAAKPKTAAPKAAAVSQAALDAQIKANNPSGKALLQAVQAGPIAQTKGPLQALSQAQIAAIEAGSPAALAKANAVMGGAATGGANPLIGGAYGDGSSDGDGGYGGDVAGANPLIGGAYGDGTGTVNGASPQYIPTDDDWLAGDGSYQSQLTNINQSLNDALANSQSQRKTYDQTYNDDLRSLGYVQGGGWNTADPLTQSGRTFSGLSNDFAARGMLDSGGYSTALQNTSRQFDQQVADAATARTSYDNNLDAYDASQRSSTNSSISQAKAAAIARKAAQYATAANGVLS